MHTVDHEPDQRAAETENNDKTILTGRYGSLFRCQVRANLALLVAVPAGTVTVIRPVSGPLGTVTTI